MPNYVNKMLLKAILIDKEEISKVKLRRKNKQEKPK